MPYLRGAGRPHGDVEPMIEAFAIFCLGLKNAHRLTLAIRRGAEFLDQSLVQRAAHA